MEKNIVITGAGRGLGLEMVKIHLNEGHYIYAMTHTVTDELKSLSEGSVSIKIIQVELTDESSVKNACDEVKTKIDILYNIAGLYYQDQRVGLGGTDFDRAITLYKINGIAPMLVSKYLLDKINEPGLIVNVSSEAGSIGASQRDDDYGYCMSKAAFNMGSKLLSNELKNKDINIFCYHPGWMRTQMGGDRAAASKDSISASESAQSLFNMVVKNKVSSKLSFKDNLGNDWPW